MTKLIAGVNDLETLYPELVGEWNYKNNGDLKPCNFTYHSCEKVWWKCKTCNLEWRTAIRERVNGSGCPKCKRITCHNNTVIAEGRSLAERFPEIAEEWHPTKNGDLKPTDVSYGSLKKVWWLCKCGHEWFAQIGQRTSRLTKCPKCATSIFNKSVICVETGVVYQSIKDAEISTGIKRQSISSCLTGRTKTAKGLHWKYADK